MPGQDPPDKSLDKVWEGSCQVGIRAGSRSVERKF